jgi:hypothetical protein
MARSFAAAGPFFVSSGGHPGCPDDLDLDAERLCEAADEHVADRAAPFGSPDGLGVAADLGT